jgi:3-hydroxybutyryl-CoA dehydrogenase
LLDTVAIIGAGPLGRRLALAAVKGGFRVFLEDVMPRNLHHAEEFLRQRLRPAAIDGVQPEGVTFVSTVEDAVREADLAIDCVPDELESKLEIFCLIDRMAPPRTVLVTPTIRLSIADLASCTYRPDKCVAVREEASNLATFGGSEITIQTTTKTSAETIAIVTRFWTSMGITPTCVPDPTEAATSTNKLIALR